MNSVENIVKKLRESKVTTDGSIMIEYTYNGDEVSDYLAHVKVRTDDKDKAIEAANKYAMEKHPEAEPRHFKVSRDNYTNVDVVDEDGVAIEEALTEDENDDAREAFFKACKSNLTWKKANAICEKYGYKLADESYVDVYPSGKKVPVVGIRVDRSKEYNPDVYYYDSKFGKTDPHFEIQTTAYGALTLEKHAEFLEAVTNVHKMVEELSKIDFMTLYEEPVEY